MLILVEYLIDYEDRAKVSEKLKEGIKSTLLKL